MKKITVLAVIMAMCLCSSAEAKKNEIFTLEIPATIGENARAIRPNGDIKELGKVLRIPSISKYPGFTASAWANPCTVAATAVNAIHITISVQKDKGRIISLLPADTIAPAAGASAAFVIDCPAGTGLFGGWAPTASSIVRVRRADGTMRMLAANALPKEGETVVIKVCEDTDSPYMVDIENKKGGEVRAYWRWASKAIATVEHPIKGTGRFEGTKYQRCSAIRANHHGVICVSTSNLGDIGGFQIIPYEHSFSKEMRSSWDKTQWLIVRSTDNQPMTARFPLFAGTFVPGAQVREKLWDFWSTYGRRSLVMCRINGGKWQLFDAVAGKRDYALKDITHLRIYAPFTDEPAKKKENI